MASRADGQKLVRLFDQLWMQKHNRRYNGNRHADQWGLRDMIDDLSFEEAERVVRYYFRLASPDHSRIWLIYNYNVVYEQMIEAEKDDEHRKLIMENTKKLLEEN